MVTGTHSLKRGPKESSGGVGSRKPHPGGFNGFTNLVCSSKKSKVPRMLMGGEKKKGGEFTSWSSRTGDLVLTESRQFHKSQ